MLLELVDVTSPIGSGAVDEVGLEGDRARAGLGHAVLEREIRVVLVPEDLGELVPKSENAWDQGPVVEVALPAASRVREVDLPPQRAVPTVFEDRLDRGVVEREEPPLLPFLAGLRPGARLRGLRNAVESIAVLDEPLVRGGRVEDVLAELLLQASELDAHLLQPRLPRGRKVRAGPLELPDRLVEVTPPDAGECGRFLARGERLDPFPERLVEREP